MTNSKLMIGRYYFEDPENLNLLERIEKAFRPYLAKFGLKPDTAHVNLRYCEETTTLIIDGQEVVIHPDDTIQPGITWIGNRGLSKMPMPLDSDIKIHYGRPSLFSERQEKWSGPESTETSPESTETSPKSTESLSEEERKRRRRRERRAARRAEERAATQEESHDS